MRALLRAPGRICTFNHPGKGRMLYLLSYGSMSPHPLESNQHLLGFNQAP